jgi:hypothetical protein
VYGALLLGLVLVQAVHAQVRSSYADRQNPRLSQSGPIYMDPNVYAYTAEFAKRFEMPSEWIVQDLKGADAVAWRMMPSYQECGWGGDPKACTQTVKCEIDRLYAVWCGTPRPHLAAAGTNGLAGRCLSLDIRR